MVLGLLTGGVVALAILYRHAETAAAGFSNQLFERNLEQAVMLVTAERPGPAEALAWREALAPSSPRAIGAGPNDPNFLALLWTLRQVVARNPCMAARTFGTSQAHDVFAHGKDGFVVSWADQSVTRIRTSDFSVDWTTRIDGGQPPSPMLMAADPLTGRLAVTHDVQHIALINRDGVQESPRQSIVQLPADDPVKLLAFDEGRLWVLSLGGKLVAIDIDSGQIVRTLYVPRTSSLARCNIDLREGMFVTTVGGTSELAAISLVDGSEIGRIKDQSTVPEHLVSVAICGNGQVLTTARVNLGIWSPSKNEFESLSESRASFWFILAPAREGTQSVAVTMLDDGGLRLVKLDRSGVSTPLSGHPARSLVRPRSAWLRPETLVTAGDDGLVRMWDTQRSRWIQTHMSHTDSIGRLSFGPDRKTLYSFGRDGKVGTWWRDETLGLVELRALPDDAKSVRAAFSRDGVLMALDDRSERGRIIIRQMDDFSVFVDREAERATGPMDFSPDGMWLAAGLGHQVSSGPTLGILDLKNRAWHTLDAWAGRGAFSRVVRHSPDGRFLAWGLIDGRLYVFEPGAAALPVPSQLGDPARAVVFSPDGDRLVVGYDDGRLQALDRRNGDTLATIAVHSKVIADVAWAPDGRTFATADSGGEVMLWCATTYRKLASMSLSPVPVQTIIFSPDSDRLVIGDDLGRVTEWDFDYYDVAIARSVEAWIELLRRDGIETPNADTMRAWGRGLQR